MELDVLDRKILYHLDIDSRQSAKQIAQKIRSNKDTVNYRINRLVENGIITGFRTYVDIAKLGFSSIKTCIRFQDTSESKEKEFFDYLNSLPEIGWVVRGSGRWDALFAVWAPSTPSFYIILSEILNRFSRNIHEKEIIHGIHWFYYNRKWLMPEEYDVLPTKYGEEPSKENASDADRAILGYLVYDSRKSFTEIAKKIGTSPQNVLHLVNGMKRRGVIRKYGIDIDYKKLGMVFCKTFVALHNIDQASLKAIYSFCSHEPSIYALTTTLGAWDLELELEAKRVEEMMETMNRLKRNFPDFIKGYDSIVITGQTIVKYVPPVK